MRFRFQLIGQNSYMLGARIFTLAITFLITALSSRFLSTVAGFGDLMMISAYYIFLREISVYSFKSYLVREIVHSHDKTFSVLIHILLFCSFIILTGTGLIALVLRSLGYSSSLIFLASAFNASLVFEVLIHNNESYFESQKRFDILFASQFFCGILRIALFLLINSRYPSLKKIVVSFILSSLVASGVHLFFLLRLAEKKAVDLTLAFAKRTISVSSIFFFSSIFYGLLNSLDIMVLSKMSGNASVGLYSPAARLNKFCFIYAFSFMSVMYPHLVSFLKKSEEEFAVFAQKIFAVLVFSSIPLQFLFPYLAKYVVYLFFGERYMDTIPILKILVFCQMPFAIYFFCSRYFLSLHREKLTVVIDFLSLIVHFLTLVLFTRLFDAKGAAAAFLITNLFLVFIYLLFFNKQKVTFPYVKIISKNVFFLLVLGAYFILTYHKHLQPMADLVHVFIIMIIAGASFLAIPELSFLRRKNQGD
ncbi:MAG: oligosaccharide flippase family protein [Candidatus Aureabacteria bacterium]|nr:oligosaccharide flippase family protein [Candidatus Auribacterota bacterium]